MAAALLDARCSVNAPRACDGRTPLMLCVAVTLLYSAGQFVLFSYFAPYFKLHLGVTPAELSLLFACFGACGLIGNLLMSRHIDHIGAPRAVMWAVASMGLSLLVWPLASSLALAALICFCREHGIDLIDCQQRTGHLASMGGRELPRGDFEAAVAQRAARPAPGSWTYHQRLWKHLLPPT
jgi:hypothetical protein